MFLGLFISILSEDLYTLRVQAGEWIATKTVKHVKGKKNHESYLLYTIIEKLQSICNIFVFSRLPTVVFLVFWENLSKVHLFDWSFGRQCQSVNISHSILLRCNNDESMTSLGLKKFKWFCNTPSPHILWPSRTRLPLCTTYYISRELCYNNHY